MRTKLVMIAAMVALFLVMVTPAAAITYGEPDGDAHPYVGLVVFYGADGKPLWRCSGTLLSPKVFLTAGHCAFGTSSARVWFDSKVPYPYSGGVKGKPYAHPLYDDFATFPNTYDIGVVVLKTPVEKDTYGVLPKANLLDALATQRGLQDTSFTVVGYGLQGVKPEYQADRERYQGTVHLVDLRSALTDGYNLHFSSNPGDWSGGVCFGDSGGPVFLGNSNIVAAVNSFVLNYNCKGAGYSYRTDIADARSFLGKYVTLP